MSSFRTALRATVFTAVLAGGALSAATSESHADAAPLTFSSNIHCAAGITDDVILINDTATTTTLSFTLITSMQTTEKSALVPANSSAVVTFGLTIGERIDRMVLRDADGQVLISQAYQMVVTGSGSCTRQAFELLELVGYSLTCSDGVTHASVSIENRGDYAAELTATADAWFPDAPSYSDALSAGLISADSETLLSTPGSTRVFNLDFKIVDQFELAVKKGSTVVFSDGPRAMAVGEGCATEVGGSTTTTVTVPDTTEPAPDTTVGGPDTTDAAPDTTAAGPDTTIAAPDTTDGFANESQAPGTSTTSTPAPSTTLVDQAGRSLPVTGRSSAPAGLVAMLLLGVGVLLRRTARRGLR